MSRSRKKVDVCGNSTADSDKPFKKQVNKQLRRRTRTKIATLAPDSLSDELFATIDEMRDVYSAPKDGKQYFGKLTDTEYVKKLRRK